MDRAHRRPGPPAHPRSRDRRQGEHPAAAGLRVFRPAPRDGQQLPARCGGGRQAVFTFGRRTRRTRTSWKWERRHLCYHCLRRHAREPHTRAERAATLWKLVALAALGQPAIEPAHVRAARWVYKPPAGMSVNLDAGVARAWQVGYGGAQSLTFSGAVHHLFVLCGKRCLMWHFERVSGARLLCCLESSLNYIPIGSAREIKESSSTQPSQLEISLLYRKCCMLAVLHRSGILHRGSQSLGLLRDTAQ